MKTPFLLTTAAAGLLLVTPAQAAKADFSGLGGKYKGTYLLDVMGSTAFGAVKTIVKVPRSGRSATIQIKGTVYAGGTPVPVAGKLRLKSNGKLKANSPLLGYYSPIATKPTRY